MRLTTLPPNYSLRPPSWFWIEIAAIIALWFLAGCKAQKTRTEIQYKDRIEYRDRLQRDTTYVHDSISIRETADTVRITRYRYIYRERTRTDTAYVSKTDSIPYEVIIEKPLTRIQEMQMTIGGWAMGIILLLALASAVYLSYKLLRR